MTSSWLKSTALFIVIILSMLSPTLCNALYIIPDIKTGSVKEAEPAAVLLYGSFDDPQTERNELITLYNLVRTYSSKVSLIRLEDYQTGMLDGTQYIFLAGVREEEARKDLGSDLKRFAGVITWIGRGIEHYASYGITAGFTNAGYTDEFVEMRYSFNEDAAEVQTILLGKQRFVPKLVITDKQAVHSVGVISDGVNDYPYAIHSGNVWCVAAYGQGGADGDVFRDVTSRIFNKSLIQTPQVYIKLAGVSPLSHSAKLEEAGRWLSEQGVPFMMELRPVFANLDYKPMRDFFQSVKQLQKQGGTAVLGNLQGWSPKDEWQSDIEGSAAASEAAALIPAKLMDTSLRAYLLHNIYPLALSGPPDLLFDPDLTHVLDYFSTFVQGGSWQGYARDLLPEESWKGLYVNELRSANRNRVGLGEPTEPAKLSEKYANLRGTNGATVIEFDSSTDWAGLKEAVLYLKQIGTTFEDLRKVDSQVIFGDTRIDIQTGRITVNGKAFNGEELVETGPLVNTPPPTSNVNKRVKQTMLFILGLAGAFVLMFVVALFASKRINRKKYLG